MQAGPVTNVGQFFRQQQAAATAMHWQIISLAPSPTPGTFKAWVMIDTTLWAVKLQVGCLAACVRTAAPAV